MEINVLRYCMKLLPYTIVIAFISTAPAFAGVTINSPQAGENVTSPFSLQANATACSNQPIRTIGPDSLSPDSAEQSR